MLFRSGLDPDRHLSFRLMRRKNGTQQEKPLYSLLASVVLINTGKEGLEEAVKRARKHVSGAQKVSKGARTKADQAGFKGIPQPVDVARYETVMGVDITGKETSGVKKLTGPARERLVAARENYLAFEKELAKALRGSRSVYMYKGLSVDNPTTEDRVTHINDVADLWLEIGALMDPSNPFGADPMKAAGLFARAAGEFTPEQLKGENFTDKNDKEGRCPIRRLFSTKVNTGSGPYRPMTRIGHKIKSYMA